MPFFTPFSLPVPPIFPDRSVDVRDFGAKEDTNIRAAVQAAIEHLAEQGGGRVIIPAGHYYTGPIHLRSGINLHFAAGCHLEFTTEFSDYLPPVYGILAGNRCYSPSHLLYAYQCHDIAVTGEGILDGHGEAWWPMKKHQPGMEDLVKKGKALAPLNERVYDTPEDGVRPRMLQFVECENVLIEGVTLKNSPSWTVHPAWCKNITIRSLIIRNPNPSPNTDGINLESCERGLVEDCDVECGDDMICLKAGRDEDGRAVGIPCKDVEIRRCHTKACRGGLTIGSEMSAGITNAYIHDCTFGKMSHYVIRIKTMKGRGGVVENLDFANIRAEEAGIAAISVTMRYTGEPLDDQSGPQANMPILRNIAIQSLRCDRAATGMRIVGEAGYPIENLRLSDIALAEREPTSITHVQDLAMENVRLTTWE